MEILTDKSLCDLLITCNENSNYIAAILFDKSDRETEFLSSLKQSGSEWSVNKREGRIKFKKTNSCIYTFTLTKNFENKIRGMRFNSMFLDGVDGDDMMVRMYEQELAKYTGTQLIGKMTDEEPKDTAISDFLDEFMVVKR